MEKIIPLVLSCVIVLAVFGGSMMSNHYTEAGVCEGVVDPVSGVCYESPHYAPYASHTSHSPTDTWTKTDFTLIHNPMICLFEPTPTEEFPILNSQAREITQDAISDWDNKMQVSLHAKGWRIFSGIIPYDNPEILKSLSCDITISFEPSPPSSSDMEKGLVGETSYDFNHHLAQIVIYYRGLENNVLSTNILSNQDIGITIRHELGHAFGLGHYIGGDSSSIMSPTVQGGYYGITDSDIYELQSLYGADGFNSPIKSQPPETKQQISISTDKQIYYYGDHVIITIDVAKVTGANATLTLVTRGSQTEPAPIPVIISELHGTITSLALDETNSPTGTVDATLSYDGQTASTSFQIDGQSQSSVISQDTTQPETPHSNQLEKFMVTQQLKNGPLSHHAFRTLFFSLNTDGFIHIDDGHKFQGYVVKPDWLDKDVQYWADGSISDEEFASSLQYLFDNNILRL